VPLLETLLLPERNNVQARAVTRRKMRVALAMASPSGRCCHRSPPMHLGVRKGVAHLARSMGTPIRLDPPTKISSLVTGVGLHICLRRQIGRHLRQPSADIPTGSPASRLRQRHVSPRSTILRSICGRRGCRGSLAAFSSLDGKKAIRGQGSRLPRRGQGRFNKLPASTAYFTKILDRAALFAAY